MLSDKKLAAGGVTRYQGGYTLLEILITLVLLAFGLTAVVNLQMKLHMTEVESYQRGQAVILAQDMISRIQAAGYIDATGNPYDSSADIPNNYTHPYVTGTGTPLGTGNDLFEPGTQTCNEAFDPPSGSDYLIKRVKCDWNILLKGASEVTAGSRVGGMIGARGCIEQIQNPNPTAGICTPANFRVTVVWQGLHETVSPNLACGQNLYSDTNGNVNEEVRRVISAIVTLGMPDCL